MAADRFGQPGRVEQQRGDQTDTRVTVRLDGAALLVVERAGMSQEPGGHAQHADIVNQGGQQRVERSAAQFGIVADDAAERRGPWSDCGRR